MSSAAEDIVTEIITLLSSPPLATVPAQRVYRDIEDARNSAQMPVVVVETGDEEPPVRSLIGRKDRQLQVHVTVLAKGTLPLQKADPTVVEVADRLLNAATIDNQVLNGLAMDVQEGATRREREGLSSDLAAVTKTFIIDYRTAEGSIERL